MERELMMTGIGGQGIQLAAQLLAHAAMAEGREVQLFGSYGGMMRGGETEATVIVGDGPIEAPPTISRTWSAIVMHHDYAEPTLRRLAADSVVLINSTVIGDQLGDQLAATALRTSRTDGPPGATAVQSAGTGTTPGRTLNTGGPPGADAVQSSATGTVVEVPATELAGEVGSVMAASMIMLGAYAAVTGLVALETLVATLPEVLPAYRRQHVALNEKALRTGHDAVTPGVAPAWPTPAAAAGVTP